MNKKITVSVLALVLVFTCIFAGCAKKGEYENPATGEKYDVVTDAEGNKVLSEDGELLVYVKDENGEYVTDESGEKVTQVQGFIGQIEENGIVEDYAYKVAVPDGWKYSGNGVFENKAGNVNVDISIQKETMARYIQKTAAVAEELKNGNYECSFTEKHFDGVGFVGMSFIFKSDEANVSVAAFVAEGNLFQVRATAQKNGDVDGALDAFLAALTIKPYAYYDESELEDVTAVSEADTQSSTAASTQAAADAQ